MADHDAQRVIAISLGKIASFNTQRRGCSLHKNLLVSTVIQRARTLIVADSPSNEPVTNPDWLQQRSYYQHLQDNDVIANFNKLYVSEAVRWEEGLPVPGHCAPSETTGSARLGPLQCDETTTTVVNMDNGITEVVRTYQNDNDDLETSSCQSPQQILPATLQETASELCPDDDDDSSAAMDVTRDDLTRKRRYFASEDDHLFGDYSHKRQRRDNPFWLKQAPSSIPDCVTSGTTSNTDQDSPSDSSEPVHNSVSMINYLSLTSDFGEAHKSWNLDHQLLHYTSESPYTTDFLVHSPSDYCIKRPADLFSSLPIDVTGQTLALTV